MSGFLVRSVATGWAKNTILAVDAGVHLSAIVRILNEHLPHAIRHNPFAALSAATVTAPPHADKAVSAPFFRPYPAGSIPGYFSPVTESPRSARPGSPAPPHFDAGKPKLCLTTGPFRDLVLPFETAKANAVHLVRHFVSAYLVTHAHLDHLSGFAVNTAAFQHTTRPKKLAALPATIDAVKAHVFNDVVWPNLTDEDGGVGLVSYQRLAEGGNLALGDGDRRGYIDVCDGLAVRGFAVSHGNCMRPPAHRHGGGADGFPGGERRGSRTSLAPSSPDVFRRRSSLDAGGPSAAYPLPPPPPDVCVVDSAAFFIRDEASDRELLMFGDVEPDRVSRWPRTARVWAVAAPKVARGALAAVFIECSYDDAQSDDTLFGHLNPRHLAAELGVLAAMVTAVREGRDPATATALPPQTTSPPPPPLRPAPSVVDPPRKRKREPGATAGGETNGRGSSPADPEGGDPKPRPGHYALRPSALRRSVSPASRAPPPAKQARSDEGHAAGPPELHLQLPQSPATGRASPGRSPAARDADDGAADDGARAGPLRGLRVLVTHVKDKLSDGPPAAEVILRQLAEHAARAGLGCEIDMARRGEALWL